MKVLKVLLVLFVSLLVLGSRAQTAQDTGNVTGKVLNDRSEPLPSAQVIVVGTNRGALTDEHGNFLITAVAPGAQIVRAQTLGFATLDQRVYIAKGQTAVIEFKLKPRPLASR